MVGGAEDEDQDGNLIRPEDKPFLPDGGDFADGRDFKFNNLSQVSFICFFRVHVTGKIGKIRTKQKKKNSKIYVQLNKKCVTTKKQ